MADGQTCARMVLHTAYDRRSACGRPASVVIDGTPLCSAHAAGQRRSASAEERRQAERDASYAAKASAEALCDELREHAIHAQPFMDWRSGKYDGRVVLKADDVRRLLASLKEG